MVCGVCTDVGYVFGETLKQPMQVELELDALSSLGSADKFPLFGRILYLQKQ